VLFILEPSEAAQAAIGKRVMVVDYPDGRIAIRYKGEDLAFRTFGPRSHAHNPHGVTFLNGTNCDISFRRRQSGSLLHFIRFPNPLVMPQY
jgi:hypothetical protein